MIIITKEKEKVFKIKGNENEKDFIKCFPGLLFRNQLILIKRETSYEITAKIVWDYYNSEKIKDENKTYIVDLGDETSHKDIVFLFSKFKEFAYKRKIKTNFNVEFLDYIQRVTFL